MSQIALFDFSSEESPFMGQPISLEEEILEQENTKHNMENVRSIDGMMYVIFYILKFHI